MPSLSSSTPSPDYVDQELQHQDAAFLELLRKRMPGMRAFVGTNKTRRWNPVIMVGSDELGWDRGMEVYGHDALARARDYAARYGAGG